MDRKAKIIATLGPASGDEATIERLILAGMNVARLNFSHGSHQQHAELVARLRQVSSRVGIQVGILQDLQGPKIRIGVLAAPVSLRQGDEVRLYPHGDAVLSEGKVPAIPVDFQELFDVLAIDDHILIDDGRIGLKVTQVEPRKIQAVVTNGGTLKSHKGINLPGIHLPIPAFTEKDEQDLIFGLEQGVDAVAMSFVRSREDVEMVKEAIDRHLTGRSAPLVIAKLERGEAVDNLDSILGVADGVMVARGDLGVEMPPEVVPVLQKHIIQTANARAKLVITATQMLDSMIHNPLPTRAEASDVANAIFDGTDVVMLSGETAIGDYPVESVMMMDRIVCNAEAHFLDWGLAQLKTILGEADAASMARAAHALANDEDVSAVAVFTMQGQSAWLMSKVRPRVPILAFTPDRNTERKLTFLWGVRPQLTKFADTLEDMISYVDAALQQTGELTRGQQVVVICGFPVGAMRPPNMALLHSIGK